MNGTTTRFRRFISATGWLLVGLAIGTTVDRLLSERPTWPWLVVLSIAIAAAVGVFLALVGARSERAYDRHIEDELTRHSVASSLYMGSNFR